MLKRIVCYILFMLCLMPFSAQCEVLRVSHINIHNGLGANNVRSIVQDERGFIWFGTTEGLFRYNGYQVTNVLMNENNQTLYKDIRIHELAVWDGRYILIRLRGRLFSMYDTQEERFIDFTGNNTHDEPYKDFVITSANDIWFVDPNNGTKHVWKNNGRFFCKSMKNIPAEIDRALSRRHKEKDENKRKWMQWIEENKTEESRLQDLSPYIQDVFCDNENNIFIGEEDRGVTVVSMLNGMADYIYNGTKDMNRSNIIRVVWEKPDGSIFMQNSKDDICVIKQDNNGRLWVGTRKHGVIIDGKEYPIEIQQSNDDDHKVSDFCEDRQGRMWFCIFSGIIMIAEPDGNKGYRMREVMRNVAFPRKMVCDSHGQIWVGTSEGICIIDPKTMKSKRVVVGSDYAKLNEVRAIYEDNKQQMWVGTIGYGLACLDNSKPGHPVVKKIYNKSNGLSDDRVESIIADEKGRLWAGTDYGLNIYYPDRDLWLRYFLGPTDLSMMFYENSAIQLSDGRLAFGTRHGVAIINPERINKKTLNNKNDGYRLCITDILINGTTPESMAKDAPFTNAPWMQKEMTLKHEQNTLTFYVSCFDYFRGQNISYRFYLEGHDKEWCAPQKENYRNYTALEPGKYVLHVKAITVNGNNTDEEITMTIIVQPPLWATWWAYLIYTIIAITIIITAWRIYRRHEQLQQMIRIEEQLTQYKMVFFTNVSHEFRMPLTIIRGCMEDIWSHENMPADIKQPVVNMYKSTKRMLRLVNQLMDFSKIHDNKLKLRVQDTEVVEFTREITYNFTTMAEQRGISLLFTTTTKRLQMPIDRSFLDKILYNLIGNAFKYSHRGDAVKVRLSADTETQTLKIRVEDTGIGIPKEKQQQLFSRFDQSAFISDSIGIGLHMSKIMIETHHGTLTYNENSPKGSIFTLTLPMLESTYKPDEWMVIQDVNDEKEKVVIPQEYLEMATPPYNNKTVLVVEDNIDVLQYIRKTLSTHFNVITASDGEEALRVFSDSVALVITDCMMPIMNGTQLVRHIRNGNVNTQVPVIMLTALTSEIEQVKAYKVGVNFFVQKPFSPKVLLTQVLSIIQGEIAKEQTIKETVAGGNAVVEKKPAIVIDAQDKRFRTLFDKWIDEHIADTDLGVEKMAEGLKLGRTALFKRVKDITGSTPNEYIRKKRIEHAQQLLADDTLTIQQVANRVGFEDQYYFSKVFKSVAGMSPSQYRKTGGDNPVVLCKQSLASAET